MIEKQADTDLSTWFSTYGVLTAERILERFHIHLKHDELMAAIKDPHNLYYQLLRVPLKNVFNGIILAQADDYRVYAQKLFIEYLISGASNASETSPGATAREDLEHERTHLIAMGEAFDEQDYAHHRLIADSQAALIQISQDLPKSSQRVTDDLILAVEHLIAPYVEKTEAMNISLRDYRSQFYNLILRTTELIQLLPDYRPDMVKQLESRSSLYFDARIGEE